LLRRETRGEKCSGNNRERSMCHFSTSRPQARRPRARSPQARKT
jgi:hypothetical protein